MSAHSQTVHNLERDGRIVLNLVDTSMVDAIDRIALLTGRTVVPDYKVARGYTHRADKFAAAGLTPRPVRDGFPDSVAECLVRLVATVRSVHEIDEAGSGLRAIEVRVEATLAHRSVLLPGERNHFDATRWEPMLMKFTEYVAGGTEPLRPSSLARGWGMPALPTR